MAKGLSQFVVEKILAKAGITVNGSRPEDIRVKDNRFFGEVLRRGSLGLGESYMNGWWDCERLDRFFERLLRSGADRWGRLNPTAVWRFFRDLFGNAATPEHAFEIAEAHYDLGNDFFEAQLDGRMAYSCGCWRNGIAGLDAAQKAKLDLVCRKLGLGSGQRVLDIGCGWGSFAKFAAEKYGVSVLGITVSKEQAELAQKRCAGLPIEIRAQDYRELRERFDRVVSIGMFEHVERRNHRAYFETVERCLKPGGLSLLHTIGEKYREGTSDPWIRKYIFPLGMIPTERDIRNASKGLLYILDWHEFGPAHYDRTLMSWHRNFAANWPRIESKYGSKVGGRFERMWRYYLLSCAGAFRAKTMDVWQIVMSKEQFAYRPVR